MKKVVILLLTVLSVSLMAQKKSRPPLPSENKPLYILDGKTISDLSSVKPDEIQKVEVVNGQEATEKYGDAGKFGVIKISTSIGLHRESFDPKVTEVWELKPQVVVPGSNSSVAPSDAVILFDGKDLSKWTNGSGKDATWQVSDGVMTVVSGTGGIKTKSTFGDVQLHIEWRTPTEVKGEGQNRGNSGIFFQEKYELQVLDSYENQTYSNGQAGAIYKQHIPLVNACRKPGEWQTYDVVYIAPRFSESTGRIVEPAYITVFQNGVLIQNHVAITGPTEYKGLPIYQIHGKGSLMLQDHGTPVSYRNIWVREL